MADWLPVAARGLHLAGCLSLAGGLGFAVLARQAPRLVVASAALALAGGLGWLGLQAAGWGVGVGAVALDTRFGQVLLLRLALVALAALLARRHPAAALAAAALAVLAQAAVGHGVAGEDWLLAGALALHLLAAAFWLGGLAPLWLSLGGVAEAGMVRRWSRLALGCVAVLAATAFVLAERLEGGLAGLVGTDHGRIALGKLALFLAMLGCAAVNRMVFTPALPVARGRLRASVLAEIGLGIGVLALAASLSAVPPGAHEQPDWPFAWQPSTLALAEPEFRREVALAAAALLGAAVLAGFAVLGRRLLVGWMRLGLAAWAVIVVALALPHLDLLLVPAHRTSFYRSPTGFSAAAIMQGAALYPAHCAGCHGADGRGGGAAADLTAGHLWDHPDGEMFAMLSEGIAAPRGGLAMPAMAAALDADQRWALIDFLRARNAGTAMAQRQEWPAPVQAPDFAATCAGGASVTLSEMRGTAWIVVATAGGLAFGPDCVSADPVARAAYALVSGGLAAGDWLVVDAAGWLRGRGGAADPAEAALRAAAAPLPEAAPAAHVH